MDIDSSTAQVHELVEQWRAAEEANDGDRLAYLMVADFVGIGPRGWIRTRDEWAERYRSGGVVNEEFQLDEVHVRTYGDAAVVVVAQRQRGCNGTTDTSGRFRITLTAHRSGGIWQITGLHVGPLHDV